MPIRGILFDKDGTLLDYAATWQPINRAAAALAAAGDPALAARLLRVGGADPVTGRVRPDSLLAAANAAEIAAAWMAAGSPFDAERLRGELDRLFRSGVRHAVPVTDLARLFTRLKAQGLALGIASSDSAAAIAATAEHFAIAPLVDFIAGYDSGFGAKPEPGMVLGFCAALGLAPATVAVVGDNRHDMTMGRAAGAGLLVGVLTGTGTRATLAELADLCLDSIDDLEAVLAARP